MGAPQQASKRQKSSDNASGGGPPPPPNGTYANAPPYNQQQFQQGPYNGPLPPPPGGQQQFPMQPQFANNPMWQPGQQPPYGSSNAPWQNGQQQGMFRQSPPLGPPTGGPMPGGNWGGGGGYRGPPPPNQSPPSSQGRRGGKQGSQKSKSSKKNASSTPSGPPQGGPYQGGWQQQQQWPQNQWGGGAGPPPQMWQQGPGSGPPRHPPQPSPPPGPIQGQPMVPVNQNAPWPGSNQQPSSSPRQSKKGRPRSSPEPMMGFPQGGGMMPGMPPDALCGPVGMDPGEIFVMSTGVGTGPDDDGSRKPSGGSSVSSREKGRGSYRCGRCGAPKKGHVCPYQPKLKRRPDEPPPETRNAAIQVEMDEFMTLRRLNLEIQGFPESYATASHMIESRVVGEPHPYAIGDGGVMTVLGFTMGNEPMPGMTNVTSAPMHVASQPALMEPESGGVAPQGGAPQGGVPPKPPPQQKQVEQTPTQTSEQKENTTTSEVPAEAAKTASA